MNAIISLLKKAAMLAMSIALALGMAGCAPIVGLAALGAGASLLAIDNGSHAPVQPAQHADAPSPAAASPFGI